jgi:hypothetical protein
MGGGSRNISSSLSSFASADLAPLSAMQDQLAAVSLPEDQTRAFDRGDLILTSEEQVDAPKLESVANTADVAATGAQQEETKDIETKDIEQETKAIHQEQTKTHQDDTKAIQEETKTQLEEHPAVKAAFDRIINTLTPLQQAQVAEQQWLSKLNEHSAHICALIWLHKHQEAACSDSPSASSCPDTNRLLACSQKLDSQLSSDAYKVGCESEAWLRRLFSLDAISFDTEVDVAREAVDRVRAARRAAVKQVKSHVDGFDRLRQRALDIKQRLLPLLTKQLELCASRSTSNSESAASSAAASDDEVQQTPVDSQAAGFASLQSQVPASPSQPSSSPLTPTVSTSHHNTNSNSTSWTLSYPSSERIRPRFYVERSERGLMLYAQATGLVADSLQWHVDRATRVLTVRGLCTVHTRPFQLHPLSLMFGSPLEQEGKRQQRQQWFEQHFELDAEVALDSADSCEKQGITLRTLHDTFFLQVPFTEVTVEAARAAREAADQRRRHECEQYRQRLLKQQQQQLQQRELRRRQAAAVPAGCFDYGRPLCAPSGPFIYGSPFLSF